MVCVSGCVSRWRGGVCEWVGCVNRWEAVCACGWGGYVCEWVEVVCEWVGGGVCVCVRVVLKGEKRRAAL